MKLHSPNSEASDTMADTSTTAEKKHYLFTYGTLRLEEHNNWILDKAHATHIATVETEDKYILLTQTGHRSFPYLISAQTWPEMKHLATRVKGDLFLIDDHALARCDDLESHPTWYCRTPIRIVSKDVQEVWAYLLTLSYFKDLKRRTIIESGDWKAYRPTD